MCRPQGLFFSSCIPPSWVSWPLKEGRQKQGALAMGCDCLRGIQGLRGAGTTLHSRAGEDPEASHGRARAADHFPRCCLSTCTHHPAALRKPRASRVIRSFEIRSLKMFLRMNPIPFSTAFGVLCQKRSLPPGELDLPGCLPPGYSSGTTTQLGGTATAVLPEWSRLCLLSGFQRAHERRAEPHEAD